MAFRRTNRVLTLMWALVFALIAVLGYVAVQAPSTTGWTKAVIPVAVIVGANRNDADLPGQGSGEGPHAERRLRTALLSACICVSANRVSGFGRVGAGSTPSGSGF